MTHYYDFKYHMPDNVFEAWKKDWTHPLVRDFVQKCPPRVCGVHGRLGIGIGWYGVRAQCLQCEGPDAEEQADHLSKKVNISDQVEAKEGLTNTKPWFNGPKTFSSVKVNPAPINDPNVLEVNVFDSVAASNKMGG